MAYWLGLDVGTTTVTAVVLDGATGSVVGSGSVPNAAEVTSTRDKKRGRSEWDAERMLAASGEAVRQALANARCSVDGVGVTGQMHGVVVDCDGEPCGPFIGWQDRRGADVMGKNSASTVDRIDAEIVRAQLDERVCRPKAGYLGPTLLWLAEQGKIPEGAVSSFLPDWVAARFTGTRPVTDRTNAAGSGLYDVLSDAWALDVADAVGLNRVLLPEVRQSGTAAGRVTLEASGLTGLNEGTPVCVACGDNQASFTGSVGMTEETVLVNVGTGGQMSVRTDLKAACGDLELRPYLDGGYLLVGPGVVGGRTFAWLRDFFAEVGSSLYHAKIDPDLLYERMLDQASRIEAGSDGLTAEPILTGTRSNPARRGLLAGLAPTNFSTGHLTRSLLEGVAQQFLLLYDQALQAGVGLRTRLVGSGNGLRRNALLRDCVKAAFGMPVSLPVHTEEAAYGAALLAGVSCGAWASVGEAGAVIRYVTGEA